MVAVTGAVGGSTFSGVNVCVCVCVYVCMCTCHCVSVRHKMAGDSEWADLYPCVCRLSRCQFLPRIQFNQLLFTINRKPCFSKLLITCEQKYVSY